MDLVERYVRWERRLVTGIPWNVPLVGKDWGFALSLAFLLLLSLANGFILLFALVKSGVL